MSKTCNNCGAEFKWAEPYTGDKNNLDGTPHVCAKAQPAPTLAPASPIDRTAVIAEIKEFLQAFPIGQNEPGVMYSSDQLDVASRIYISRTMKR